MLSKTVLVKNITNLSEARYCAGMGVEYLSFDLDESSPYFLSKPAFEEIRNWLTGVKILGQVKNATTPEELQSKKIAYQLDGVIISNEEWLNQGISEVFFEIFADDPFLEDKLNIYSSLVEYFILVIREADDQTISRINRLAGQFPVLSGYSLRTSEISLIENGGFAFEGSKEERPGFNHYDQLMDKLESLEAD